MKKTIMLLLLAALFVACEKEGEVSNFDYDIEELYGTWDVTHMKGDDGDYYSITAENVRDFYGDTYITINSNNSQRLRGWFGDIDGTYKAEGKSVMLYSGSELTAKCDIAYMKDGNAEARITIMETMYIQDIKLKRR